MRLSRKGWVVLTTIIVISIVFAFYFLVYVKGNESQIIANKMRVLTQIKGNIDHLIDSQKRILANQTKVNMDSVKIDSVKIDSVYYERGFLWKKDSATWVMDDGDSNKMAYTDFLGNELIEREDVFDFIAITMYEKDVWRTLYSNFPLGRITFPQDSTITNFNSKNIFEVDFGYNKYLVFNTQIGEHGDKQVYLTGYVNKSQYNEDKREVSVFYIICAVILTTLMILALPLLKIQIMSKAERLGGTDVFLAGASLVIIPSVLILFFFLFITNITHDKEKEEDKLKNLHIKLSNNFKKELENTIDQLSCIRGFIPPSLERFDDSVISKKQPFKFFDTLNIENYYADVWKNSIWNNNFQYFNSIFWTDSTGNIHIYLSSEKNPRKIGSLKHRNYIMNIVNEKASEYNGEQIAFESIRSVSDGNYEIGLGIPSNNKQLPVLAASFSLASLIDPILEEGYGFCLFNKEGQTIFHSERKRNLNEDFVKETGEIFIPYMKSGSNHFASINYMGKDHYIYFNRVIKLDNYYLATFLDKSYTYSPNLIAFNTTVEMQLAYLTFLFLAYLIIFLSACRRNKLKQKVFVFNWLMPHNLKNDYPFLYFKLLLVNFIVFIYILVAIVLYGFIYYSPDFLIHSLLFSGLLMISLNFWFLSIALPENERMYTQFNHHGRTGPILTIMAIYGVLTLGGKYFLIEHPNHYLSIGEFLFLSLLGYIIYKVLIWKIAGFKSPKNFGKFHRASHPILKYFKNRFFLDYKLYTCSLIILFSVIPTSIFFTINYNMEKEINFKHKIVALKERIDNWKVNKSAQFFNEQDGARKPIIDSLNIFVASMITKDSLNYAIPDIINFTEIIPKDSISNYKKIYTNLYQNARIYFDQYGLNSQGFINNDPDSSNFWTYDGKSVNFKNSNFPTRITGPIDSFKTLFTQKWWVIILFFIVVILILYSLLNSVIHKIFGLDYKEYFDKVVIHQKNLEIGKMLTSIYAKSDGLKNSFNNTFIVGVNASHVYGIYNSLKECKKKAFYTIDFLDLPNEVEVLGDGTDNNTKGYFLDSVNKIQIPIKNLIKSQSNNYGKLFKVLKNKHLSQNSLLLVFIEHFEYAYDNEHLNRIKLNILQRIVGNPDIQVVISSEISPTKIYEFYEDSIKKAQELTSNNSEKSLENREKIELLRSEYKQWLHILGAFYKITVPLEINISKDPDFLQKELQHGQYLNRIIDIPKLLCKQVDYCEDYILNVQEISYTYYYAIWNSLTKEERYIVYDIAHDQFVNTNNVDGIVDLLQKGLLVYDHSLRLMNDSFTNFVLTKVDSAEALERELQFTKKGNWSTASAVLVLVIISLIIFISFGKVNILEDVNALLGSLAAVFTLLLRMSGIFVIGKSPK